MTQVKISRMVGDQGQELWTEVNSPFSVEIEHGASYADQLNWLTVASFQIGTFGARAIVPYEEGKVVIGQAVAALLAVVLDHAAEIRDAMKEAKP